MKNSIRTRFTLIFIGIMALVIFGMYAINNYFLEKYYMNQMVKGLQTAYETVDHLLTDLESRGETLTEVVKAELGQSSADTSAASVFRELNDNSNINVVLIDADHSTVISASREGNWLLKKLEFYLDNSEAIRNGELPAEDIMGNPVSGEHTNPGLIPRPIVKNDRYCIMQSVDWRSMSAYLESWGYLSDGKTTFLMSMPVALIHDSVALTNRFLMIVGIVLLLAGSALVYLATNAITRPINHLAGISERMTKLDFTARYAGREKDEIGVLGRSMNTMSDQLEKTIGELKTANNELKQDIDEKNRIDAMRKDFIANVSHELKTPIALIQGYAEGLTEGMAEDADSRDYYCNVIADEAQKMNKMVKQLTSLNNLELGNERVEFSHFDITALIRSIVDAQQLIIKDRGVNLSITGLTEAYVWADEFKIEEVITNYFNNALNHLEGDKNIRISVEEEADKKRIRIGVYNDGEPIPEEDIPHLWEKFFKVDKARTREYGGSGIGLSIVKAIIESHGQECGVENREHGVFFWFTLDSGNGSLAISDDLR
ncbi:MAG: HAMP domain-containing sensor histidine kinase [Eubacteriales bacterium]|nr:HAMP domain-containing sensor histidine kinase [Eubacteriales bacterium]